MSEWQPARWKSVHPRPWQSYEDRKKHESTLYHARETNLVPEKSSLERAGCTATNFYEVLEWPNSLICEHKILTD